MSVTGGLKSSAAHRSASWSRRISSNVMRALTLLSRPPRTQTQPAWRTQTRVIAGTAAALACLALTMFFVDAPVIDWAKRLPLGIAEILSEVTDFGKSSWFLVPIGLLLILIAAFTPPTLPQPALAVLASIAVRLEFLFAAIAVPSLFTSIIKRLIGRARPMVGGDTDPFRYLQLVWRPDYASLPSGHATTAFAAAIAIGFLWPRLRALMWAYAVIIGVSRVLLVAHHPSDVIAGAIVGIVGAVIVRDAFAARGLGFMFGAEGSVHALPGPSFARIKRVARNLFAP
jgi:undecaprenyl-diphosphatase